jgi:hypothetical protein
MEGAMTGPFTLTEAHEQALRDQVFDDACPGFLLHDFQVVLDYLGTKGVRSSGKYNLLPLESIGELDERLGRPLRLDLKRPQLRSHPYLMGLNLLLRASGLGRVERVGTSARLCMDPEMRLQWERLNPTERYFNLLEAWFLYAKPEMVGDTSRRWGDDLGDCLRIWSDLPAQASHYTAKYAESGYLPKLGRDLLSAALMDLAGLIEVENHAKPTTPWFPAAVRHSPFGDALLTVLARQQRGWRAWVSDDGENEAEEPDENGGWQPLLAPYFPEWRETLELPEEEFREGMFVFRVSLDREVWRRIAIPADCTLDDLVCTILRAFRFDSDHLYEYRFRDRTGAETRVCDPDCGEGPFGDEIQIGELPLETGHSMDLTYDFGDNWHFDVKLERIDPPNARLKGPRIVERHGKAPRQYCDDWY